MVDLVGLVIGLVGLVGMVLSLVDLVADLARLIDESGPGRAGSRLSWNSNGLGWAGLLPQRDSSDSREV